MQTAIISDSRLNCYSLDYFLKYMNAMKNWHSPSNATYTFMYHKKNNLENSNLI